MFLRLHFLFLPLEYYSTLLVFKLVLQKNLVFLEVNAFSAQENTVHKWSWLNKDNRKQQGPRSTWDCVVCLKERSELSAPIFCFLMLGFFKPGALCNISQLKKIKVHYYLNYIEQKIIFNETHLPITQLQKFLINALLCSSPSHLPYFEAESRYHMI